MSFEKFMDKVLESAEAVELPVSGHAPAQQSEPEAMSNEQFEKYLIEWMNGLLEAATARRALGVFADVTVWKLAEVGHHCGQGATGNIVRLFGRNLENMADVEQAQKEANSRRERGFRPS